MQDVLEAILNKFDIDHHEKLSTVLTKSISVSNDTAKSTYATSDNLLFQIDTFFEQLKRMTNQMPKKTRFPLELNILQATLEELGIEIEKEETFIFYHMKDLGKFRIKDTKLKEQLKSPWSENKEYSLDDNEYPRALKNLMRLDLIEFRRGNMTIKKSIVLRYR